MGYILNCTQTVLIFLSISVCSFTQQKAFTETQKIDHLIAYIASLNGATFIRNGDDYSAKDASTHLQMKREKAGKRIKTAEDFILHIATKSSMSGEPYQIKFANGKLIECALVLKIELRNLNEGKSPLRYLSK
jgi:hypothetical protein